MSPQERVKKGISFVPQTRNVFAELTVRENLEIGAFLRKDDINKVILKKGNRQIIDKKSSQLSIIKFDEYEVNLDQLFKNTGGERIKEPEEMFLKELWDDGLMYMGMKGAPHCPRCVTTLSSHEVALGYKENTPDPSVFVKFRIVSEWTSDRPKPAKYESLVSDKVPTSLLAWTTTPWTLPANTALAVSAAADYSIVEFERDGSIERLIVASALEHILEEENKKIVATIKGSDLDGMAYELLYLSLIHI